MSHQEPQPGWGQPPQGRGAPPPRRKGRTGKILGLSCLGLIVLIVVVVVAVFAVGGGDDEPDRTPTSPATQPTAGELTASRQPQEESGPRGDVKITACQVDPVTKWAGAKLLITNRSSKASKASNYIVQVEFVDASGKRLSEATTATNNVAPGQQSEATAQGLDQITTKVTCRITDVTRFAS
ncbi:FxLYD domain-containing protein [Streptomyces sp. P9(2023)]|uniref:FxLYD domain-containing protein n=1 Tax=Streptomyces sp. P9(2023) TaxID=3064394 RepID=UPI0028F3FB20|nr:FxLYD domain-containing protein [Streptomyces sp. P9(2023)]MDT9688866.1 FxLYD domain-containing protein [Streptomyces sp. P9(2023)]